MDKEKRDCLCHDWRRAVERTFNWVGKKRIHAENRHHYHRRRLTGCGIARDLALRGIPHCLLEKDDFAAGATGACHGLLHSGGHTPYRIRMLHENASKRTRFFGESAENASSRPAVFSFDCRVILKNSGIDFSRAAKLRGSQRRSCPLQGPSSWCPT